VGYDYNGAGQRVSRTWSNDEIQRNYYWNGWSVVNEYLDDDNATYYDWERSYVGGLAERAYSGGAYAYYFTDHLGSTQALYNEAKTRTGGIDYTAYGAPTFSEGAASGITRRYTGHDYDPLTGDYFAPYRFYSPSSHRWLTRDPLGMVDGPNVYAYVRGNPINTSDPLGLTEQEDDCDPCKEERDAAKGAADDAERALVACGAAQGACALCIRRCVVTPTPWCGFVCVGICGGAVATCNWAKRAADKYGEALDDLITCLRYPK
jgi:RHS repeat-associated protein